MVPAIDIAEHFALETGATRRVHARDRRPDESSAGMPVVVTQLALEQGEPDTVERALARASSQPLGDGHLLQWSPVANV